jgi:dTDP-4-dehydrorhamnose reductase
MTNKSIVSIIGASGFIGTHLYNFLKKSDEYVIKGTCYAHHRLDQFDVLNITDKVALKNYLKTIKPDFLILLAGNKDVKDCEKNYEATYKINTQPMLDIIDIIGECGLKTRTVYFSSDYVFNGQKGDYTDEDEADPKTNYGKTKLLSEKALFDSNLDYVIIRPTAVIGQNGTFWEWLIRSLKEKKEIKLFSNIYFTPTPIGFLCENVENILNNYREFNKKVLHVVGKKKYSRFDFGVYIAGRLGLKTSFILAEKADLKHGTFQADLSMIQSKGIVHNKQYDEYITDLFEYD